MSSPKKKLIRTATVAISLDILLKGQLEFLNRTFDVVGVASFDPKHFREIERREGIKMHAIELKRDISLKDDVIALWKMFWFIKKQRPEIVHAHTPKAALVSMMAAWINLVPKRIYTVTGLRFEGETGLKRIFLIAMEKLACGFANIVIPEGKGVLETLQKNAITKKPLRVLHNGNISGIDTEYFNPQLLSNDQKRNLKSNLKIPDDAFVFVFVGRLANDKVTIYQNSLD